MEEENLRLEHNFSYHAPTPEQVLLYERIREKYKELAYIITENQVDSRELEIALMHLETSCMWCNAGIARNT